MLQSFTPLERQLNHELLTQPAAFNYRYDAAADCHLRRVLFRSLAAHREDYLRLLFPDGPPSDRTEPWSLQSAQGAVDGAEYSEAARGTACGHIFKNGESSYSCRTCAVDDTCVMCARCFDSSEHEGHMVMISISTGNGGCCDCGDREAWKREVHCAIHSLDVNDNEHMSKSRAKDKGKTPDAGASLPPDLIEAIRSTISRCIDYLCDVYSCSPEQLKREKTEEDVRQDERESRLSAIVYGEEVVEQEPEFALILWNDEKHTMEEVENQVARACRRSKTFGREKAYEVDRVGRSIVHFSRDLPALLEMSKIIEHIKVTATIRSARDTFRELMSETIIDWIADIAGCYVGSDLHILRNVVCEELLQPWRAGSRASNKFVGEAGLYDHEHEDNLKDRERYAQMWNPLLVRQGNIVRLELQLRQPATDDVNDDDDDEDDFILADDDTMPGFEIQMDVDDEHDEHDERTPATASIDVVTEMDVDGPLETGESLEAQIVQALAGLPPRTRSQPSRQHIVSAPTDSDEGESRVTQPSLRVPFGQVPSTPNVRKALKTRPSKHWLEKPISFRETRSACPYEDIWQRVRIDFLILYDLRLWKTLRTDLRNLYINTVVAIPKYKAVLGLRFAGLYTALAQVYLIADREPDHSIINLSLQILTTPTITADVVERGNFLTNLMAILYTFLTTRQVGFPEDVNPKATLAVEAGTVTNRRMFHFLNDLRYMLQSDFIHRKVREEPRYLLQFIDFVKLHQGVCPNVRAIGEHVEFESETWIGTSMVVQHTNRLCKQVAASFTPGKYGDQTSTDLQRAIRTVAQVIMINALGMERRRFVTAEIKKELTWHTVGPFVRAEQIFSLPKHVVQEEPMSFHHPLHYLLSWLIEESKDMSRDEVKSILRFSMEDLKDPWNVARAHLPNVTLTSENLLGAIFDQPLRVCAWLAQTKASMWVRNGITLRHQAQQYRGVLHRDVGFQRDILMLQTGLVLSGGENERVGESFLAQMIDRFQMTAWFRGDYSIVSGFEDSQQLDVIEDFLHLLVVVLSERGNLIPATDERAQHDEILRHDIAHALCFKPLSFSDLESKVTTKIAESDEFTRVLESITTYKPPEGLSDTGTFELRPDCIELVNPYYVHYTRNQREEAEAIYKKHVARKTGKVAEDVVYEPKLSPIGTGLFSDLTAFTRTPLFCQVIAAALGFAYSPEKPQLTRLETFLPLVLHLILIAVREDNDAPAHGFMYYAVRQMNGAPSVGRLLTQLLVTQDFASCHPAVVNLLRKMPIEHYENDLPPLAALLSAASEPAPSTNTDEERERKKLEAKARQARIMAQMKQQQASFLQNQGLSAFADVGDEGDDDDLDDEFSSAQDFEIVEQRRTWSFPRGTCILCQESTNDEQLYGTFEFLGQSTILRSTPVEDMDFIKEVINTPVSLDRSAEDIRPFGIAGQNKKEVYKVASDGALTTSQRQDLSKGFPHQHCTTGPVATSCGHMMHFSCFELYAAATARRQQQQIARNHPERAADYQEFVCPLCKALGNTFVPIIWKSKECAHEHELHAAQTLSQWLTGKEHTTDLSVLMEVPGSLPNPFLQSAQKADSARASTYISSMFSPTLVQNMQSLNIDPPSAARVSSANQQTHPWLRMFGPAAGSPIPNEEAPSEPNRFQDLLSAYDRINKSVASNIDMPLANTETDDNALPALSRAFGMSISSFEIANRGVGADNQATSMITDFPEQALTHLRVLSETIESYLAVHVLHPDHNDVALETMREREIQTARLFGVGSDDWGQIVPMGPLFSDDIFLFLVDWLSTKSPNVAEANLILQLCFWAEIVKTIFVYREPTGALEGALEGISLMKHEQSNDQENFRLALMSLEIEDGKVDGKLWTASRISLLQVLVEKYALSFLRKSIILMHVRYGLDFECPYNLDPNAAELQRLTTLLHIPSIVELCAIYNERSIGGARLRDITGTWWKQAGGLTARNKTGKAAITVPHPAIFELVGLPRNYDTLTEEATRRKCPTTGKELTDPVVCLMCGEIFCSQSVCCAQSRNKGGVYQHLKKHNEKIGIFINIRKCHALYAHGPGLGGFHQAPYLDKHGEADPSMRRHHQLFLNQKRYDKLFREVWLNHTIPTVIARKLEGDINPGGWETL